MSKLSPIFSILHTLHSIVGSAVHYWRQSSRRVGLNSIGVMAITVWHRCGRRRKIAGAASSSSQLFDLHFHLVYLISLSIHFASTFLSLTFKSIYIVDCYCKQLVIRLGSVGCFVYLLPVFPISTIYCFEL